jgi:hypothetical protein
MGGVILSFSEVRIMPGTVVAKHYQARFKKQFNRTGIGGQPDVHIAYFALFATHCTRHHYVRYIFRVVFYVHQLLVKKPGVGGC